MHFNRSVVIGLAAVAAAVLIIAPGAFGSVLPVLVVAICPLSMIFMMRGMAGHGRSHGNREHASNSGASGGCCGHSNGHGQIPAHTDQQTDDKEPTP